MQGNETFEFAKFHHWRLKRIIELSKRLSALALPIYSYTITPDGQLHLAPSQLYGLVQEKESLSSAEQENLGLIEKREKHVAYNTLLAAYTIGLMGQTAAMSEEERTNITPLPQGYLEGGLEKCSEAWFVVHEFVDKDSDESFQVSRAFVTGQGLEGKPMQVESVSFIKEDELVREVVDVSSANEDLFVRRNLGPAEDELLTRLIETSGIAESDPASKNWALYKAGFIAMTGGFELADQERDTKKSLQLLVELRGTTDETLKQLATDLLIRYEAIQASRAYQSLTSMPTEEQLDGTIETMESLVATAEE